MGESCVAESQDCNLWHTGALLLQHAACYDQYSSDSLVEDCLGLTSHP